ncbi:MAG: hypothetical protein V3U53_01320 [bacterium]
MGRIVTVMLLMLAIGCAIPRTAAAGPESKADGCLTGLYNYPAEPPAPGRGGAAARSRPPAAGSRPPAAGAARGAAFRYSRLGEARAFSLPRNGPGTRLPNPKTSPMEN